MSTRTSPPLPARAFRRAVATAALGLTMLAATAGCGGPATFPPSATSPLSGQAMPDFQRSAMDGAKLDTKGLRGKVAVVKFFAKYCEPCKRTLPAVEALAKAHPEIAFVGIAEDESAEDVKEVITSFGLSFPVVHDQGNVLSGRYRVRELPITFVADRTGKVRWVGGPDQTETDLERAVAAAGQ